MTLSTAGSRTRRALAALAARSRPLLPALGLLAALAVAAGCGGCSADPLDRLIAQLDRAGGREQAIEELLAVVRRAPRARRDEVTARVIGALGEAYRVDRSRPQIIGALALLRDRRAEHVFLAAIGDAERGGAYFEAAVRAARTLADLGCRAAVPKLVRMLRRAHRRPEGDREGYLRRAAIEALELLGDRRAAPALIEVLRAGPTEQSVDLNRRAAKALGSLGAASAAGPLVDLLGGTAHRLLVYEASRRALCDLGPAGVRALRARAGEGKRRGARAVAHAASALRVLGDLEPSRVPEVAAGASLALGLAAAEGRLRARADRQTLGWLGSLLTVPRQPLAVRLRAAELLGWYGDEAAASALAEQPAPAPGPLRWAVARAYARSGREAAVLERLLSEPAQVPVAAPAPARSTTPTSAPALSGEAINARLAVYRARVALATRCAGESRCLVAVLRRATPRPAADDGAVVAGAASAPASRAASAAGGWREVERAALELGRLSSSSSSVVDALAGRLAGAHPQVLQAVLVSLERLVSGGRLAGPAAARVARIIDSALESGFKAERTGEPLVSRAYCLARRLQRAARRQRSKPTKELR